MSNPSFMESLNFLDLYCIIKETDSRKVSKERLYEKQAERQQLCVQKVAYDIKLYDASDSQLVCSFKINDLDKGETVSAIFIIEDGYIVSYKEVKGKPVWKVYRLSRMIGDS